MRPRRWRGMVRWNGREWKREKALFCRRSHLRNIWTSRSAHNEVRESDAWRIPYVLDRLPRIYGASISPTEYCCRLGGSPGNETPTPRKDRQYYYEMNDALPSALLNINNPTIITLKCSFGYLHKQSKTVICKSLCGSIFLPKHI